MILEAFSRILQQPQSRGRSPEAVLHDWLSGILLEPAAPQDHVAQVIHAEIRIFEENGLEDAPFIETEPLDLLELAPRQIEEGVFVFVPKSASGERLLNSLVQFCRSYDHWQFSRLLHQVNASDFCRLSEYE